jgi:hypothetical protein
VTGNRRPSGSGKAAGEDGQEEKGTQMSKDEGGWNSSLSENPVRSHLRRLVDWINLTGAKKVHSLIDKVYKRKNLEMAWEKVKANRGSGGVDGQTLEAFEAQLNQQLERLQRELKEDTYQPLPVRQHPIPKRDKPGEHRMLGIPTIYDRVCQQAHEMCSRTSHTGKPYGQFGRRTDASASCARPPTRQPGDRNQESFRLARDPTRIRTIHSPS